MLITSTSFLTERELSRGPDLLRPGTATGHLGNGRIAFICTRFTDESGRRLFSVPAAVGHEQIICKPEILKAMFGSEMERIEAEDRYERPIYDADGNEAGRVTDLDHLELRHQALKFNLFGRFGTVRGRDVLMLWNQPEAWENMTEEVVRLLGVSGDVILTAGTRELGQLSIDHDLV
jgi:hypothetical protein